MEPGNALQPARQRRHPPLLAGKARRVVGGEPFLEGQHHGRHHLPVHLQRPAEFAIAPQFIAGEIEGGDRRHLLGSNR